MGAAPIVPLSLINSRRAVYCPDDTSVAECTACQCLELYSLLPLYTNQQPRVL